MCAIYLAISHHVPCSCAPKIDAIPVFILEYVRQLFQSKFHFGCLKITNVKSLSQFSFNAESFRKFIDMYPLILRNRFAKRDFDLRNSFSKKISQIFKISDKVSEIYYYSINKQILLCMHFIHAKSKFVKLNNFQDVVIMHANETIKV